MKIYFAASIRGGREDQMIYAKIISVLKENGTVLTEHIGDIELLSQGETDLSDEMIFKRDIGFLEECNAIVAEVTVPSLGVGYKIGLMEGKKPILCLFRKGNGAHLSAMLSGNASLTIMRYRDTGEIESAVKDFMQKISHTI